MHILSHLAYPYLAVNFVALIVGQPIPLEYNLAILLFSLVPDFDYFFNFIGQITTTRKYKIPGHHHGWPSHWPILYIPLAVLALVLKNDYLIIGVLVIYIHLAMDTFFCNEGVMIFYPISKKWYSFFSESTKNKPGLKWNTAYGKLLIYRFDKIAFIIMLIHLGISINNAVHII